MQQENNEQALLYQQRRKIKQSIRPLRLERHHWQYISQYLRKNSASVCILLSLIVSQALLEIGTLLFLNSSVREQVYVALHERTLGYFVLLVCVGALIYLVITYVTIAYERKMVLGFINDLRHRWFTDMLQHPHASVTEEDKADFIAKVSYHLPLLLLGIDHSLFGCVRWFLSVLVLIALSFILGIQSAGLILGAILLSIIVAAATYLIARYFISQEVTSYSQVLRHVSLTLSELISTKNLHTEQSAIDGLDMRVGVDTYFRIRRDVWLRYASRVLFTFMFVAGVSVFIIGFSHPEFISFLYDPALTILATIISLYSVRLLYEAVQTGLYLPPLKLGLFLSIPDSVLRSFGAKKREWKQINFRSNKTKLFLEGEYFKNVSITFKKGYRYLITGDAYSGKTSLAQLIGGSPDFNVHSWLIKIDEQRVDDRYWINEFSDRFLCGPELHSQKTLGGFIFAREVQDITERDISMIYELCEKYPAFAHIRMKKRFMGESIAHFQGNAVSLFAIQALRCIIGNISLIVIDNRWVDPEYPEIVEMMRILGAELPQSTLIVFSRKENSMLAYNLRYTITHNEIRS